MKVAFTGGGTGGHVYPGLAIIQSMQELDPSIEYLWIGENKGMEGKILGQTTTPFYGIRAGKLRRYFSVKNVTDIFNIIIGFFQAWRILRKTSPDLLFSKGGFVAVPSVWAARLCKIPIFIHESDYALGLANRLSAGAAKQIFVSFPQTIELASPKWRKKMTHLGGPIRPALLLGNRFNGRKAWLEREEQLLILVMGGSQGAKAINDLIVAYLPTKTDQIVIVHQTGQLHEQYAPYAQRGYHPKAYFQDELADLIAAADVVISRAGAGAINEFGAMQKALLLLPLRGHQSDNARWLAEKEAVHVLYPDEASLEHFKSKVQHLIHNDILRKQLATKLHTLIKPHASKNIAQIILTELQK